jgi:hypothetical protein
LKNIINKRDVDTRLRIFSIYLTVVKEGQNGETRILEKR